VEDAAVLLDVLVGYDAEDPITAMGVGHSPVSYTQFLDPNGLREARIGVLRQPIGSGSEPASEDFKKVDRVFDNAVLELQKAGATVIDPVTIPKVRELLEKRGGLGGDEGFEVYFGRSKSRPFNTQEELQRRASETMLVRRPRTGTAPYPEYLVAREELMFSYMKVMADHRLDAILHKSAEHQPSLIGDGVNPPYVNIKGATHLNTFLVYAPAISVPAGWTSDDLPVGITLLGRPYADGTILRLAYAYEQATKHRVPPSMTPALPGEP
jgi:Asp-tRNA(Asn)/Glu-tRNA(Gln) amidotransferase A subunit family amidase